MTSSSLYIIIWGKQLVQPNPRQPITYFKNLDEVLPVPSHFSVCMSRIETATGKGASGFSILHVTRIIARDAA